MVPALEFSGDKIQVIHCGDQAQSLFLMKSHKNYICSNRNTCVGILQPGIISMLNSKHTRRYITLWYIVFIEQNKKFKDCES